MQQRRTQRHFMCAGAVMLLLAGSSVAQETKKPEEAKKPDSGKFTLTIRGAKMGVCDFKFDADGGSTADLSIDANGTVQKVKVTVKSKAGKVQSVAADAGGGNNFTVAFDGKKAKVSIAGGAADSQDVSAGVLPFGNLSPHLLYHTLSAYDEKKAGSQTFNLMMAEGLPQGQITEFQGKLIAKKPEDHKVGAKTITVTPYTLTLMIAGMEIEMKLFADKDKHLLAWDVPSQTYTAVREGFEDVLKVSKPGK